jgi:hypothetical protein
MGIRSRLLILLAGVGLIMAGILCLCLSGAVFTGWWQGTLDAFGVGFTVGGIVDVLAIFALNQSVAADERRREENDERAQEILKMPPDDEWRSRAAYDLLWNSRGLMDLQLADQLKPLAKDWLTRRSRLL